MGRWLNRIRTGEENTGMLVWRADRTDETFGSEVLSVSSASQKHDPTFFAIVGRQRTADYRVAFEERAATLEYDEGMLRAEAEQLAAEQIGNVLPFRRDVW